MVKHPKAGCKYFKVLSVSHSLSTFNGQIDLDKSLLAFYGQIDLDSKTAKHEIMQV